MVTCFMKFANGFDTFMDTDEESRLWHKGIYEGIKHGLKRHNPYRVKEDLRVFKKPAMEWYRDDDHYYDVPYLVMYMLSSALEIAVVGVAAWTAQQLGLDVTALF